jgi:hypothetical protein
MGKVKQFVSKVRRRRSDELERGIESHEMRMWMALADALEELENPPCCNGGPQWGHAWECPKCPD